MPPITPEVQKYVKDFIKKNNGLFPSLGKGDYQGVFLKQIKNCNQDLAEFCAKNSKALGLDKIKSADQAKSFACDFLNGYKSMLADNSKNNPLYSFCSSFKDKYDALDQKSKQKLESQLSDASVGKNISSEVAEAIKSIVGIDISEGVMKGLKSFMLKKMSGFGDKEDVTKAKSESEIAEKMFDFTTINTFSNGVKGMMSAPIFSLVGLGGAASGFMPIAIMCLPALVLWDIKKVAQSALGSPFEEGTLSNPIKNKKSGLQSGPIVRG